MEAKKQRRNHTEAGHVCAVRCGIQGNVEERSWSPSPTFPYMCSGGAWNLGRALKTFCLLRVQRVCGGVLAATDRRGRGRCMAKREPQHLQAQPEEDFAELAEASPEMWACSAVGGRVKKLVSTACGLTSHCCAVPS